MHLVSLAVTDFRNLADTVIEPDPEGTTVITGRNGAGKTSLLEAAGYLATLQSFRGSPREALVRRGTERAILRAETRVADRTLTIEAEVSAAGRSRTQVNRQAVRRRGDLHDALRVTVFSPEDIGVVRAGPSDRRRFLDETLAVVDPKAARSAEEVDKVLRQRSALLRTAGRTLRADAAVTLDVWDARLEESGTRLVEAASTWWNNWRRWRNVTTRVSPAHPPRSAWPTSAPGPVRSSRRSAKPATGTSSAACRRSGPTGTSSS